MSGSDRLQFNFDHAYCEHIRQYFGLLYLEEPIRHNLKFEAIFIALNYEVDCFAVLKHKRRILPVACVVEMMGIPQQKSLESEGLRTHKRAFNHFGAYFGIKLRFLNSETLLKVIKPCCLNLLPKMEDFDPLQTRN